MPDIIRLLPDAVANQIAAGEVIQRPASAVKELLENAIDAGAGTVQLIIKDGGRTLIQVVDDGCGMSPVDARMSFERHATSKIKQASDLFEIRTFGFRGEALASIAAIAQVELRTRRHEDEIGTQVIIEGSEVISQEAVQCQAGTSFMIKNLFFNVPARRSFLKSDAVEVRHIYEEFHRVAMVNPDVQFIFHNNGRLVYQLNKSNLRQRIVQLFGAHLNQKIVAVEEKTDVVTITGFTGKPEHTRKVRGEQYLFINGRFVKIPYLQHAIENAYAGMVAQGSYPSYFLYLGVNPAAIDINIHPTKTEVKLLNENVVYSILKAAVRKAIGQFAISGSLDFDAEMAFGTGELKPGEVIRPPVIRVNPDYTPFDSGQPARSARDKRNLDNWDKLYQPSDQPVVTHQAEIALNTAKTGDESHDKGFMQIREAFIATSVKSGMMLIDIAAAYERILFEGYIKKIEKQGIPSQQELFPLNLHFGAAEAAAINQLKPQLKLMGFTLENLSSQTFVIQGIPQGMQSADAREVLDSVIAALINQEDPDENDHRSLMARNLAKAVAKNKIKPMSQDEMRTLVDQLFACEMPSVSPQGKTVLRILSLEQIREFFK